MANSDSVILDILVNLGMTGDGAEKALAQIKAVNAETASGISTTERASATTAAYNQTMNAEAAAMMASGEIKKGFVVTTEAEYLMLQKAHEALSKGIIIRQASGLAVETQLAAQAELDVALSTESALQVANTIETKAAEAARLKQADADIAEASAKLRAALATQVDTAATVENTAAHGVNATVLRESMVILRELERGNISRLPGSASILMSQLGVGGAGLATAGVGLVAALGLEGYFKWQEKIQKEWEELNKSAEKAEESVRKIVSAGGSLDEHFIELNKAMAEAQIRSDGIMHNMERMEASARLYSDSLRDGGEQIKQVESDTNDVWKARIDLMKEAGVISSTEAAELQSKADLQAKINKMADERRAITEQIAAAETEREQLVHTKSGLPDQRTAEQNLINAQSKVDRDNALIKDGPAAIAAINNSIAAASQDASKAHTLGQVNRDFDFIESQNKHRDAIEADIEAAKQRQASDETALAQSKDVSEAVKAMPGKMQAVTDKLAQLDQTLNDLDKRQSGEKNSAIQEAAIKMVQSRIAAGVSEDNQFRAGVGGLEDERNVTGSTGKSMAQIIREGDAAQFRRDTGKGQQGDDDLINLEARIKRDQDAVKAMQDVLTAHGFATDTIVDGFKMMVSKYQDLKQGVANEIAALHQDDRDLGHSQKKIGQ